MKTQSKQFKRDLFFLPETIDKEFRTVEAVISAGTKGLRKTRHSGDYYEELEITDKSVILDRANNGAPILLNHQSWSIEKKQVGVIEKAWVDGGKIHALLRFSKRDQVTPIWEDIADGIYRHFSVGYEPLKVKNISSKDAKIPTFLLTKFRVLEVSLISIGFDDKATTRSKDEETTEFEIEIENQFIQRSENMPKLNEENEANENEKTRSHSENNPQNTPKLKTEEEIVAEAEKRMAEIHAYIRSISIKYKLSEKEENKLILDKSDRAAVNEFIVNRQSDIDSKKGIPSDPAPAIKQNSSTTIERGMDEGETRHEAVVNAVLHRIDKSIELTPTGRRYYGRSIPELTRLYLDDKGENTRELLPSQVVKRAFTVSDDYALIFEDIGKKSLVSGYEKLAKKQNWTSLVEFTDTNDYKDINRVRMGETPSLKLIEEHGEMERSKKGSARETFRIYRWGRAFGVTKEALINDDLNALRDMKNWGAAAARCETNLFWTIFSKSQIMGDGKELFHQDHKNLHAGHLELTPDNLSKVRVAMSKHMGIDGEEPLGITPATLIVPSELVDEALKIVGSHPHHPEQVKDKNIWTNRLNIVEGQHLSLVSPDGWFVAADKDDGVQLVEMCHLNGVRSPEVEIEKDFGTKGVSISAELSLGAKALDWIGFYKVPGKNLVKKK